MPSSDLKTVLLIVNAYSSNAKEKDLYCHAQQWPEEQGAGTVEMLFLDIINVVAS